MGPIFMSFLSILLIFVINTYEISFNFFTVFRLY